MSEDLSLSEVFMAERDVLPIVVAAIAKQISIDLPRLSDDLEKAAQSIDLSGPYQERVRDLVEALAGRLRHISSRV
ncbi:hypothetical protein [Inquilinus limosus]|nr:hypothetical protein [Inquilinus limosus]